MLQASDTILYPTTDLAAAKAYYTELFGVGPDMDQPYYMSFTVNGLHVGFDPNGHKRGFTGPVSFWNVEDIKETVQKLVDGGGTVVEEPHNVGGGKLVATVKDADGNLTGLMQG
jgi:predicted enzyme related to lactoylglutathione lyase